GHLSPNTQFDKYYSWNPSIGGGAGNWVQESASTIMDPQKGYIVRAPNSFSFTPTVFTPYTATFSGTPNNGDFDIPITVGTLGPATTDDKLNLIGNPYPSAIDADLLLNDPHNSTLLEGTIYFWTHNAPPSAANPNPFYGNYTYNYSPSGYASYNATGGTTTVPSGYGTAPTGYIASGQSFFAIGIQNGQVQLTNAMRVRGHNQTFFRPGGEQLTAMPERHRIWLNFANTQGLFSQTLVGYVADATNGIDRRFDGPTMSDGFALYSIADGKSLGIQGRSLPFDATDVVPLGYTALAAGQYTIGIDRVDGLFENQDVFLEDKLLGTVHDLRQSAYTFTASAGVVNDRFVLRYVQNQLSNPQFTEGQYVAFVADGMLTVSTREDIKAIYVYDLTGKRITMYKPDSGSRFNAPFDAAQGVYLIKIHLVGGEVLSGKVANQ
ncbi:MAG TPA: T9SS type A sorting domain-containing protein, partial [Flavobacterium sp.]|nr:T9SS type A sorting domain-containing protein [Flavobacterium sp.]